MAESKQRTIAEPVVGRWHPASNNTWSAWCLAHHARCHRAIWLGPALSPALSGHGLINDEDLASTATIVLWWTMLRLILWPYRHLLLERNASELASTDAGPSEPD
ncbi:hypothetical protein XarbCFBP6827_19125 [Xanthomonas arboricola]|nr:hypothetical protein XarCFBP6762_05720 [Xanthomonas arboricola]PPU53435.1 hypothetical protein XarbCFBP6827_19125 [Xanthomonas arboricola]